VRIGETRTYDDGRVAETVYKGGVRTSVTVTDVADVFDWASYVERFDADGTLTSRDYTPDPVDETPPVFVSGTAVSLAENSGAGQTVYVARATDDKGVTGYSLSGLDKDAFTIDAETGAVTLIGNPDFEQKPAYEFTVQAEDAAGNTASRTVSLSITDRDEVAPVFTSPTSFSVSEDTEPYDPVTFEGRVVYRAQATDDVGVVEYDVDWDSFPTDVLEFDPVRRQMIWDTRC
jgi:hypothetical protein